MIDGRIHHTSMKLLLAPDTLMGRLRIHSTILNIQLTVPIFRYNQARHYSL